MASTLQNSAVPYICDTCRSYLSLDTSTKHGDESTSSMRNDKIVTAVCAVCQDLWKPNSSSLKIALEQACQLYGGMSANHFSASSITIGLPGELNLNYRIAKQMNATTLAKKPFSVYLKDLKLFLVKEIQKLCKECHEQSPPPPILSVNDEEQGFLSINLLCVPPKNSTGRTQEKKKKKRQRWRPFVTQGGDPRVNLESRIQQEGYQWYTMTEAEKVEVSEYHPPPPDTAQPMEHHFAVFRKPIYIYGYYTKARRDVSQSPFVVMRERSKEEGDDSKNDDQDHEQKQPPSKKQKKIAKTLGVTSVEEQICNPIGKILEGISTQNNLSSVSPSQGDGSEQQQGEQKRKTPSSNVQYGMCKFHASGREDMDVRMLIRPYSNTIGRPFCVQLIDAKRALASEDQLHEIVHRINHTTNINVNGNESEEWKSELWHGQNPYGVGVCPQQLRIAPASAYSNLQADTESKVKHYGCHCWSERILPKRSDAQKETITDLLFPELKLPLTIQQRTPLRVVHRRANLVRERQILQLEAWRVDDHHFRLEMSTQAGTYVKEFVHGDLLRTQPSIASMMGCKTNLLLLDCEGIELKNDSESQTWTCLCVGHDVF